MAALDSISKDERETLFLYAVADLSYEEIGAALRSLRGYRLVVVKSTVTPGTTRSVVLPILEDSGRKRVGKELGLCANPEFLREGSAIEDALHPDKLVIGAVDDESGRRLKRLYRALYGTAIPPTLVTTPETAELVKYASNAFLAAKVSCINTIANIAQNVPSVDVEQVAHAIGLDPRIGPLFLKAGPGMADLVSTKISRHSSTTAKTRTMIRSYSELQKRPTSNKQAGSS